MQRNTVPRQRITAAWGVSLPLLVCLVALSLDSPAQGAPEGRGRVSVAAVLQGFEAGSRRQAQARLQLWLRRSPLDSRIALPSAAGALVAQARPEWAQQGAAGSSRRKGSAGKAGGGPARWPPVNVTTLGGPSNFGWVETYGAGIGNSTVNQKTCILVVARTRAGRPFDLGPNQRAFFVAFLRSGSIYMVADVEYLPRSSMHLVCWTLPTCDSYHLTLRIEFTNTYQLLKTATPASNAGYAFYKIVLSTNVQATGSPSRTCDTPVYRQQLPLCTADMISRTGNQGYWDARTWYPTACRLARLAPQEVLQCLNGKRILMMGDSELRILYGVLQLFMQAKTRDDFVQGFSATPKALGDILGGLGLSHDVSKGGTGPPLNTETGMAATTQYEFLNGRTTVYGGIYAGFSVQQVTVDAQVKGDSTPVQFNLTYASYFSIAGPLFGDWMLNGALTNGAKVTDGGTPVDVLVVATHLHDVTMFRSSKTYAAKLARSFLPSVASLLRPSGALVMYGGLTSLDGAKKNSLYKVGNPRLVDFAASANTVLQKGGFPSFVDVSPLTSPRIDFAVDATHYAWPVSLAMLDLWLGSYCSSNFSSNVL